MSGLKVWVRGIVQGVGFRPFVFNLAEALGIEGLGAQHLQRGRDRSRWAACRALQRFVDTIRREARRRWRASMTLRSEPVPANGFTAFEIHREPAAARAYFCRSRRMWPSARTASASCSTRPTGATATHSSTAPTAGRASPSSGISPTTGPTPPWPAFRCARTARRNTKTRATGASMPSRWPARSAARRSGSRPTAERLAEREDAMQRAREWLKAGKILAIKGLGGFHLACDASNPAAVAELRRRKKRSDKPFALMAFDLETVQRHCLVSPDEAALLDSRQRPGRPARAAALNRPSPARLRPGRRRWALCCPTPRCTCCCWSRSLAFPEVLVMTSGNLSEEPIAYRDEEARERLGDLADAFLLHDRPIHMRVDDSVARVARGQALPHPPRARLCARPAGPAVGRAAHAGGRRGVEEHLLPGPRPLCLSQPPHRRPGKLRNPALV